MWPSHERHEDTCIRQALSCFPAVQYPSGRIGMIPQKNSLDKVFSSQRELGFPIFLQQGPAPRAWCLQPGAFSLVPSAWCLQPGAFVLRGSRSESCYWKMGFPVVPFVQSCSALALDKLSVGVQISEPFPACLSSYDQLGLPSLICGFITLGPVIGWTLIVLVEGQLNKKRRWYTEAW